jgi:hypothetical protein
LTNRITRKAYVCILDKNTKPAMLE